MRKTDIMSRLFVMGILMFTACYAFAQTTVISPGDFVTQVAAFVQSMGGMITMLKISGIILLLIASMKVTVINQFLWSKLGNGQIWVAPGLGLIAGVLSLGTSLTFPAAFAYLTAGAGAVYLHEVLDLVKQIPGIGPIYVSIINAVEGLLGGPASQPAPVQPVDPAAQVKT